MYSVCVSVSVCACQYAHICTFNCVLWSGTFLRSVLVFVYYVYGGVLDMIKTLYIEVCVGIYFVCIVCIHVVVSRSNLHTFTLLCGW